MKGVKKNYFIIPALLCANVILAQDLAGGIEQATEEIQTIIEPVKYFLYAIAAVIAVFGALRVYSKFQNQDNDVYKAAGTYGFAFIFLIAATYLVDSIFTG